MSEQERPKLELKLASDVAQGRYANGTVVTRGRHEVVLDFVAALPNHPAQIISRVVLPTEQARALLTTLQRTLDAPAPAATPPQAPPTSGDGTTN